MSAAAGIAPAVLNTLEFPAALERVAALAAGPLGADRVRARRPAADAGAIRAALAQVTELAALLITDDAIRAEPVPDLRETLDLLAVPGSVLEGPALVALGDALGAARLVGTELHRLAPRAPRTAALLVPLPPKDLEPRLRQAIGPDGEVLDGASRELGHARRAVREARERLVRTLEAVLQRCDPGDRAPDAGVTVRGGRYVIPIRHGARGKVGGIVHDESATRATVFVEPPEVIELGNELRAREAAERREVLRVLRDLTERLRPHAAAIDGAWDMCVAFDDLCARARYTVEVNGFAPEVGAAELRVRQGRHPLLLGGAGLVVPFDLELEPDERTVLVSGPNTGGKTVFIKAVGLLALLAQSGIIPPLGPESTLPVFDRVFADIGDRQSISESLSTFSGHVAALRDILDHAGPGSLVLLDEVGGGTDPAEGGALAAAVLLALTRRRVVTLATTHLGALKRLATQTVGVVNASLQFDAESLTPTYRLLKGVPGRSYGLAIARRLGLDGEVLADAERSVPQTERALDALVADVERRAAELAALRQSLDEDTATLHDAQARAAARDEAAAARERDVAARERALEAEARAHARAYLLEARKTVEAALGTARAAVDEATAREARRMVEDAIRETAGAADAGDTGRVFRVGERVRRGAGGAVGTVREVRGDGHVAVEFGSMRMVLPAALLEPTRASPTAPRAPARAAVLPPEEPVESEISLRRMRPDDAAAALERALDAAVLADLPFLRIIHGKGTGALRRVVQEVLGRDRRVARFSLAPPNQGGHGVTVAEFHP